MRGPWQKAIASIYVSSYVFSLVALILTVMMLPRWPFLYEEYDPTRQIFLNFGLSLGAVLIGLENAGVIFGPPILAGIILWYLGNGNIAIRLVHVLGWALMEAHALRSFAMYFLDMYNNSVVLYLILYRGIGQAPFTSAFILSFTNLLFLIAFVLSFSVRTIRHVKSTQLQKKAQK